MNSESIPPNFLKNHYIQAQIDKINKISCFSTLCEYYGIEKEENANLMIDYMYVIQHDLASIILDISYEKKNSYFSFPNLPNEINDLIDSFICCSVKLKFILQFPDDYPVKGIKWELLSINNTINNYNLDSYYKESVRIHNLYNKYKKIRVADSIDVDILIFISKLKMVQKINNFEEIMDQYKFGPGDRDTFSEIVAWELKQ